MDSNRIILDSNIWIASVVQTEPDFKESIKIITKLDSIVMPDFILQEIITVLKVKKQYQLSLDFYKMVKENNTIGIVKIDLHTDEYYQEFFAEDNSKLSFVDSALLHLHKSKYYKVITLDKNLKERLDMIKVESAKTNKTKVNKIVRKK